MKPPPSHRQVRRAIEPRPTEADAAALYSWCIQMTAFAAKSLADTHGVDPQLYESLKALQLVYDRFERKAVKAGMGRLLPNLPTPPEPL